MNEREIHKNILIDTNVWLDYFLGRSGSENAAKVLEIALDNDFAITTTPSIIKDVFFLISSSLKRKMKTESVSIDERNARAINEISWECIRVIQEYSIFLNQGFKEHLGSMMLKDSHNDYEDDLLISTANASKIDFIVTNDQKLHGNKTVNSISPKDFIERFERNE